MSIPEIRRSEISRIVIEKQRASIARLAQSLDVSDETIRRDLNILQTRGHVVKVHGGAVAPNTPGLGTFERRSFQQADEKKRIALAARKLFKSGDSLMIDAGSTTDIFAEVMATLPPLTVITNSLQIARTFWQVGRGNSVVLIGGELRLDTAETLGEMALQQLSQFNVDHAVLTVGGISNIGQIMRYRIDEVMIARTMMEKAKMVTILADHTKILTPALMTICEMDQITHLVTDQKPPANLARIMEDSGTQLIIADLENVQPQIESKNDKSKSD